MNVIKSGVNSLKMKLRIRVKKKKALKKPEKIVEIVEEILKFNGQQEGK